MLDFPDFTKLARWLTHEVLVHDLTEDMRHTASLAREMVDNAWERSKHANRPISEMTRLDHRYAEVSWLVVGALAEIEKAHLLNQERALEIIK